MRARSELAFHGGAIFDGSAAYETLGFSGPDVHEGVASLREKRGPTFSGPAD